MSRQRFTDFERGNALRARHYFLDVTPSSGALPGNLEPSTLFRFAVNDFETIWNALVGRAAGARDADVVANFLLAKHAVLLLELCCRVADAEGPGGLAIQQFSRWLEIEEKRYFLELPCGIGTAPRFVFPSRAGVEQDQQLLSLLFDLIRNGQAHYYQQLSAMLADGSCFGISLTGARPGDPTFAECRRDPSYRAQHLTLSESGLWLVVQPEALFIDVMLAAKRSSLFSGTLPLSRFSRELCCSAADLRRALNKR